MVSMVRFMCAAMPMMSQSKRRGAHDGSKIERDMYVAVGTGMP
jgi:hypothetical protein